MKITRRTCITTLAAVLAAGPVLVAKENGSMKELLETSVKEKKGVMLYVKGQAIPGLVLKVANDMVELRSREYSHIIVRMDAIDAVAMS